MFKVNYKDINLACIMQDEASLIGACKGVLTLQPNEKAFRFEQAVIESRTVRNLKLYEGTFVSIVHMKNGKYQIHFRTLEPTLNMNCDELANTIRDEIREALKVLE